MPGIPSIPEFLRKAHVPYTLVPHRPAFTAQENAATTHVPSRAWAKVIVCVVDGEPIEAVVPVPLTVNFDRLLELAGGREIRLAQEDELPRLSPGCEPGVTAQFRPLSRQSVFVDVALASELTIVFHAGTLTEAICMRWADFAKNVRPIVGAFAGPPRDCVGAHRLSYRE